MHPPAHGCASRRLPTLVALIAAACLAPPALLLLLACLPAATAGALPAAAGLAASRERALNRLTLPNLAPVAGLAALAALTLARRHAVAGWLAAFSTEVRRDLIDLARGAVA